jgi:hypothetical protein
MRRSGSSKQRLWLGSGRYSRRSRRRRFPYAYSHSDRYANSQPDCDSIGDRDAATDANTQNGAVSKAATHAFAQALIVTTKISIVSKRPL